MCVSHQTNTFKRHPHCHHRRRSRRRHCRHCPRCSRNLLAQHECWTFGIHSQQQSRAIRELLWLMCTQKLQALSARTRLLCTAYVQCAYRSLTLCIDDHWGIMHTIWNMLVCVMCMCACMCGELSSKCMIVLSEFSVFIVLKMWWNCLSFQLSLNTKKIWYMLYVMCVSYGSLWHWLNLDVRWWQGIWLLVVPSCSYHWNHNQLPLVQEQTSNSA